MQCRLGAPSSGPVPPQKVALDGAQMPQHGSAGAFGVARQQRIRDELVLAGDRERNLGIILT
ncbi:hypothetical protein MPLA_1650058 [Mesorhizobium sp. ORS 3359]|nr:hypothetical protein MPLA_1650058 [Mesorhizobium sp. ORS 3359]